MGGLSDYPIEASVSWDVTSEVHQEVETYLYRKQKGSEFSWSNENVRERVQLLDEIRHERTLEVLN